MFCLFSMRSPSLLEPCSSAPDLARCFLGWLLNWALRTWGSGVSPTWTLCRVFKESFPRLEAAATEIT